MIINRGLGDDAPAVPVDYGQASSFGWAGALLALAVYFIGSRFLNRGGKQARAKRRRK